MNYRRFLRKSSMLLLLVSLWSHNSATYAQENDVDPSSTTMAIADFGWDFYQKVRGNEGENVFYSPASISTALTMIYVGARGSTAEEMSRVLHLPLDQGLAAMDFGPVLRQLQASENVDGYKLSTANRVWVSEQLQLNPSYLQSMKQNFQSGVEATNFLDPAQTAQTINSWVAANTNNKITEIVESSMISRDMLLFLANAIYFKGNWETRFNRNETAKQPFYLDTARLRSVEADTMHRRGKVAYGENTEVQAIKLPFKGDIAMTIILPKQAVSLESVEAKLSRPYFAKLTQGLFQRNVMVYLPKFTIHSSYDLRDTLSAMGMSQAFSNNADFSGISSQEFLKISHAIHKGFVMVNEEGAEAAAVTGIGMSRTSVTVPFEFRVDRPFIFVIHAKDDLPLFVGRIADPTKGN